MNIVNVSLKENPYKIIIGEKILAKLGQQLKALKIGRDAVIITSPIIKRYYGRIVAGSLKRSGFSVKFCVVADGERSKSAKIALKVMEDIAKYDVLKQVFVVALGGGVIGDLAGYVAAAYKRGINYVQVPTTFLAQIDSAIGGKTAVDLPIGKNLIGAFHQPKMVYSDVHVLRTLDKRQMRNGLSEAVKYGIIDDKSLFNDLVKNYQKVLDRDTATLTRVVLRCSRIKTKVVVRDEKETKGIRTILNFGHTIGHAIEAAGGYRIYHHGEAIALGMRVAADLSCRLRLFSRKNAEKLNQLLSDIGLPKRIMRVKLTDILRIMLHDKKFISGKNRFVLAKHIGKVVVREGVPLSMIKKSIQSYR